MRVSHTALSLKGARLDRPHTFEGHFEWLALVQPISLVRSYGIHSPWIDSTAARQFIGTIALLQFGDDATGETVSRRRLEARCSLFYRQQERVRSISQSLI